MRKLRGAVEEKTVPSGEYRVELGVNIHGGKKPYE